MIKMISMNDTWLGKWRPWSDLDLQYVEWNVQRTRTVTSWKPLSDTISSVNILSFHLKQGKINIWQSLYLLQIKLMTLTFVDEVNSWIPNFVYSWSCVNLYFKVGLSLWIVSQLNVMWCDILYKVGFLKFNNRDLCGYKLLVGDFSKLLTKVGLSSRPVRQCLGAQSINGPSSLHISLIK